VTSRDFCFWLQGVFEIGGIKSLDVRQAEIVRNHLDMVFAHEIDPSAGTPEHQAELSSLHEGKSKVDAQTSPFVGPDLNNILLRC
jgi:hypothetical protein